MDTEKAFASVAAMLRKDPRVTEARMFGATGLRAGDKFFAMLYKGHLVVKLPRDRVEALVASGDGQYFDPGHGRLMKEWVAVGPEAESRWRSLAQEARAFVGSEAKRAPQKRASQNRPKRRSRARR